MPKDRLSQLGLDGMATFLQETEAPLVIGLADGTLVWVNDAFADLLDYTVYELTGEEIGQGKSWKDLTVDKDDLHSDEMMLEAISRGEINKYSLSKSYLSKNGQVVRVRIVVKQFPTHGAPRWYFASVFPLEESVDRILEYLEQAQRDWLQMVLQDRSMVRTNPLTTAIEKADSWAKAVIENPLKTLPLWGFFVFLLYLIFGREQLLSLFGVGSE